MFDVNELDGNDFPWTAKQRSAEGKSATVRIVLLKRGVRERKDFPDAKGIHRVMGEPRAAHFAAQRRRARCMTRTRARESMSTPVSKRKNSHVSVSFFFCERCVKKAHPRGKMREGADSFVKNAERLNGLHFPAAERSDCAQGKTTQRLRRGRREEQITTRRRRFQNKKLTRLCGLFVLCST